VTPDPYKESLSAAVTRLIEIREQIYDTTFQVAITGELKEWSDTIEEGDSYTISKEVFGGCSDENVRLLVRLMTAVEKTCDSLLNFNNLEVEE